MGIGLAVLQGPEGGQIRTDRCVVHIGRSLPEGKKGLTIQGPGIAEHHGKIFYAYGAYHYVNLTVLPTEVIRGAFFFHLDSVTTQCLVIQGDQLRLGETLIQITELSPPRDEVLTTAAGTIGKNLQYEYVSCRDCSSAHRRLVIRATAEHIDRIWDYTDGQEILRASVDFLVHLIDNRPNGAYGLKLARPVALAIRERPTLRHSWPGAEIPVEKSLAGNASVVSVEDGALPAASFDHGAAFRFFTSDKAVVGIGAGIVEGISDPQRTPRADHLLLVQYPAATKLSSEDICVVHHVASQASQALASTQATRLRKRLELERAEARLSQQVFHRMLNVIDGAAKTVGQVASFAPPNNEPLASALALAARNLEQLKSYAARGRMGFPEEDPSHYFDWLDLIELCKEALLLVFEDLSPALQSLTDAQVCDLEEGRQRPVYGDRMALGHAVFDLLRNADRATGKTGQTGKRVHVFLDVIQRYSLPYARVRVADDGAGMEAEALATIFEGRFSTQRGRHGLGAQAIAETVRVHCGFIDVASSPGRGTVVSLLLPAPAKADASGKVEVWRGPYLRQSRMNSPVTRCRLEDILATDKVLNRWYALPKGDQDGTKK